MYDPTVLRRTFFSAAAALVAGMAAAMRPASARPLPTASAASSGGKRIVAVAGDNPVYGASAGAFERYGYSPAVRAGGLLFIAGVVGMRPDGTIPAPAAEQAQLAFARLSELLRLEGLGMEDLVEMVSYHVDLPHTLEDVMPVKERHVPPPFPAWTILGIEALALPELKIEIRAVAALRS